MVHGTAVLGTAVLGTVVLHGTMMRIDVVIVMMMTIEMTDTERTAEEIVVGYNACYKLLVTPTDSCCTLMKPFYTSMSDLYFFALFVLFVVLGLSSFACLLIPSPLLIFFPRPSGRIEAVNFQNQHFSF